MANTGHENGSVPGLQFFSPKHDINPGTAKQCNSATPTIFQPLKIRAVTLKNRICVSPMCHYSCAPSGPQRGVLTPLWFTTVGHYAFKGAALVMSEATAVSPTARISVNCPGLWNDAQQASWMALADVVHSHGGLLGVQLSHSGRKGSTQAPWVALREGKSSAKADITHGGWPQDVVGPSGGSQFTWDGKADDDPKGGYWAPREMSQAEIRTTIEDFAKAARRAVKAGVDVLEIHASHGYLFHQFLSPITNCREDDYGGSFENRIRIVVETIQAVRAVVPHTMPLFVRISTTDWMEDSELAKSRGSWDLESTTRFARMAPSLGVDVLEVSSGGNFPEAAHTLFDAGAQHEQFAAHLRKELRESSQPLLIGVVGEITTAVRARNILQNDSNQATADLISVGRQFLKNPGWVMHVAEELGVEVAWPTQIARPQIVNNISFLSKM